MSGGRSSLFQSQGGSLHYQSGSYDASIGGGTIGGRVVGGAQVRKHSAHTDFIAGTQEVSLNLPTDVFDSDHSMSMLGAGMGTSIHSTQVSTFAGYTSVDYGSPFFGAASPQMPAAELSLQQTFGHNLSSSTQLIMSQRQTGIEAIELKPSRNMKFAAAAGVGSNRPYTAASAVMDYGWGSMKTQYVKASDQFRRADVRTPLVAEPSGANVLATLKPFKFLEISAAHQNFLVPSGLALENTKSSINQVGSEVHIAGTNVGMQVLQSTYDGHTNSSFVYSGSRELGPRISVQGNYYDSRTPDQVTQKDMVANVQEQLTPRWSLTEVVSASKGQTTVSAGGAFLSNIVTISLDYQTFYVPARIANPFDLAMILDTKLHLPNGLSAHGETFVAPDGRLLYTTDIGDIWQLEGTDKILSADSTLERASIGTMLLRGQVQDIGGHPVPGAALMIDQIEVYTNDEGLFDVRERHVKTHRLQVLVNDFLDGQTYRVVFAPATTRSTFDEGQPETVVVVERVPEKSR